MCEGIVASIFIGLIILGFASIRHIGWLLGGKGKSPASSSVETLVGCIGYVVVAIIGLIVFAIIAAVLGI